jgi:DNA-binding HxlR family transcriptional regulator
VRTYGQREAVALALDVVGDRWAILIVRELLITGARRYSDLQRDIPGIATNLLAARLRELEAAGVVRRDEAPSPYAGTFITLTPRGEALRPVLTALARWGTPLLASSAQDGAARDHWVALTLEASLRDRKPERGLATLEVRSGDTPLTITVGDGPIRVKVGVARAPDATLGGPRDAILAVLLGDGDVDAAAADGVTFRGDAKVLRRIRP